jgi:hypothetical protein
MRAKPTPPLRAALIICGETAEGVVAHCPSMMSSPETSSFQEVASLASGDRTYGNGSFRVVWKFCATMVPSWKTSARADGDLMPSLR